MEIQAIKKSDTSTTAADHPMQTTFRVAIEKGILAAAPPIQRELPYFEWSIVTTFRSFISQNKQKNTHVVRNWCHF